MHIPGAPTPSEEIDKSVTIETAMPIESGSKLAPILVIGIIVLVCFFVWRGFGPSAADASWYQTLDEGIFTSEASNKPMLVLYTADWCPPCQKLKKKTFSDSEVRTYLKANFVQVKIDLSNKFGSNNAIAQEYGIQSIPAMIIYASDRSEVSRLSGYQSPGELLRWLDSNRDR